jgi:hypothetical protein
VCIFTNPAVLKSSATVFFVLRKVCSTSTIGDFLRSNFEDQELRLCTATTNVPPDLSADAQALSLHLQLHWRPRLDKSLGTISELV